MQLSPDHCLAPKWPSASAGLSTATSSLAPWPSCPRDHSLCSTKMPSAADITAVSSIHATLLADHVSSNDYDPFSNVADVDVAYTHELQVRSFLGQKLCDVVLDH